MPQTKEQKKEYDRLHRIKNKERFLKRDKEYRNNNKEYYKEYRHTVKGKKSMRITDWKRKGILCFDYNLLYDIYVKTSHCEFCNVELTIGRYTTSTTRCLDHDHSINDMFNVRGVLCHSCNTKDVLK